MTVSPIHVNTGGTSLKGSLTFLSPNKEESLVTRLTIAAPGRNVPLVEALKGSTELPARVLPPSCSQRKDAVEPSPHSDTWMFLPRACCGFTSRRVARGGRNLFLCLKIQDTLEGIRMMGQASLTEGQGEGAISCF